MSDARPDRRRALLALLLIAPVPSLGVLAAMIVAPGPAGHAMFLAAKGWLIAFPVAWFLIIEKGQPLATNTTLLGREQSVLHAPFNAVVIGMTTLPAISPGEPVCNLGKLPKGSKPARLRRLRAHAVDGLEERVSDDLAANVLVVDPTE